MTTIRSQRIRPATSPVARPGRGVVEAGFLSRNLLMGINTWYSRSFDRGLERTAALPPGKYQVGELPDCNDKVYRHIGTDTFFILAQSREGQRSVHGPFHGLSASVDAVVRAFRADLSED